MHTLTRSRQSYSAQAQIFTDRGVNTFFYRDEGDGWDNGKSIYKGLSP
jgi:hypothetical protein